MLKFIINLNKYICDFFLNKVEIIKNYINTPKGFLKIKKIKIGHLDVLLNI